jgi:hypothetical protein
MAYDKHAVPLSYCDGGEIFRLATAIRFYKL